MPQSFLNKRLLYALATAGLLSRVAQIQLFAHNKFPLYTLLFNIHPLAYNYLGELYVNQLYN